MKPTTIITQTLSALFILSAFASAETVRLYFDPAAPQIAFAAGDIKTALEKLKHTVEVRDLNALATAAVGKKIVLATAADKKASAMLLAAGGKATAALSEQAYALRTTSQPDLSYWVLGGDAVGAMYGGLQVAEDLSSSGLSKIEDQEESPFMLNRGMKLNLPLDRRIPTYVGGWSATSAKKAIPHVWDMTYWKTLIDQQARNRYNMLSVWVHHPFPALVRVPDYPKACLPNIEGFDGFVKELNLEQRIAFWRGVMDYAHDRGMKFYFFNWNIYVDYAEDQYPELKKDPKCEKTIDYMSKSMKALMETYPQLDGFGITSGDGMEGTRQENTDWTWAAMGKAVEDHLIQNPQRKFNLIHRGVKSDPETCNAVYGSIKKLPNATFNMSAKYAMAHMYSTPAPRWTGDITSCSELGLKTWLTFRNDDYFYLNWGDPKFVRDFMYGIPLKDTVVGMYIGIDGYNPSRVYCYKNEALNGQLEIERRWYMELLWGRISYNPEMKDDVFVKKMAQHYPKAPAKELFDAWTLASRSLPKVTELIMDKWSLDFHWYPEGCWSDPGRCSGFRTISDEAGAKGGFAGQNVAKGSSLSNIADSAAGKTGDKKSSYMLADEMQADAKKALTLIDKLESGGDAQLDVAIKNVKQMGHLSTYYAHKIRGATFNKAGKVEEARFEMSKAYGSWMAYSRAMDDVYKPDSFRNLAIAPDWKYADAAVLKEYTDLGGKGVPECEDMFTISTSASHGSVATEPSGGIYAKGAVVELTATPDFGYAFSSWSGDFTGQKNQGALKMNAKKSVTANFVAATKPDILPWIETFTIQDGLIARGAPRSWQAKRDSGLFQIRDHRLQVNGGKAEGIFETAEIQITSAGVKVSLEVQSDGGLDGGDYVKLYKIVDSGKAELIGEKIEGKFEGTKILEESKITGEILKLRIETKVSGDDETYYLDNLKVE